MDSGTETRVVVTDVRMPFASMVGFLVKLAFAAIPATIIVTCLVYVFMAIFGLIMAAISGAFSG